MRPCSGCAAAKPPRARPARRPPKNDYTAEYRRDDAARDRVCAQVAIAIGRESETEAEECERLAAMMERIDGDEAYINVESRPLRDIVNQLCGELDLKPDWSSWTKTGWPARTRSGPDARPRWSPFHQNSRGPILEENKKFPVNDRWYLYDP